MQIQDESNGYRISTYQNHTIRTVYLYKKVKDKPIELLHTIKISSKNLDAKYTSLSESIICGFTQPYLISK